MNFETEKIKSKINDIVGLIKKDKKVTALLILLMATLLILTFSEAGNNGDDYIKDVTEYGFDYIDKEEIRDFLENIQGAGKVEIMITYNSSKEYIYAKDTDENSKDKNNIDNEINYKSEHIIIKEDGDENGLVIKEIYPEIRGIAVICEGGNNPVIKEQIVSSLSALFGISTNKISVAVKSS